jgi:hypothetical protein
MRTGIHRERRSLKPSEGKIAGLERRDAAIPPSLAASDPAAAATDRAEKCR